MTGAEVVGELRLFCSPSNRHRVEAHLGGELHSEMTEPTQAKYGDRVWRACTGIAQSIEGRDSGTKQRSRIRALEPLRYRRQRVCRSDDIVRVSAVIRHARYHRVLAGNHVSATTRHAPTTVASVPADSHALSHLPLRYAPADGVHQ